MLSLFRTNQSFASLLLFGYALLLQLPVLIFGAVPERGLEVTYYGRWIGELVGSGWLAALLPPALLAVTGILANYFTDRYRFARTNTQFPGLIVILTWAMVPVFHGFDLKEVCNILLLLAIGSLGSTYKSQTQPVARFNAGWWIGLASVLLPTYLLFLPVFIVGISIFSTASLRHISQLLVGALVAYFLAGTAAYLTGDWVDFYEGQLEGFGFANLLPATLYDLILFGVMLSLTSGGNSRSLLTIEGAKNNSFVYWVMLFTPLVVLFGAVTSVADAQVILVPLGILLGLWLARRSERQAEFYHLLAFSAAIMLTVLRVTG